MKSLKIKPLLTVLFALSLMQTQAQINKSKEQSRQKQSASITEKVNNINGGMPNRISMNVTVPKQTQGATFGEKINAELLIDKKTPEQKASLRGIITGSITWSSETPEIASNNQAVSSVGNLASGTGGAAAASYARSLAVNSSLKGAVTTIYAREAGSGMATGRRQYQPVFYEGQENGCTDCIVKVHQNPYFQENTMAGEMPSREKDKLVEVVDDDCDGVADLLVSLVNEQTGAVVASVKTEHCGDFFFENLPYASYILKFGGEFISKKSYDITFDKNGTFDVAGELLSANNQWAIKINTGFTENLNGNEKVNAGLHAAGGTLSQGASLLGGALPGGAVISAAVSSYSPGEPIPGIDLKLGKASTEREITSKTNEKGQFEFIGLSQGNYTLTSTIYLFIDSSIPVNLWLSKKGYDYYKAQSDLNNNSEEIQRKGWDGTVKGGSKIEILKEDGSEKIDKPALTTAIRNLQEFKNSVVDLEKLLTKDKRQSSIKASQVKNVKNRIDELESSLKNLGLLGKTAATKSDLDAKLNLMNTEVSLLLENLSQLGNNYSSISNVLKTKHDTAKNSVTNIR
ncbi:MAG TPA: carboxypeptidase-like regulatory domain-containing protein [Lutibacter sp.]